MITYLEEARQFQLDTPNASYVLTIADESYLLHTYWGKRIAPQDMTDLLRLGEPPFVPSQNERERACFMDCAPFEYPCCGIGDYREAAFCIETETGAMPAICVMSAIESTMVNIIRAVCRILGATAANRWIF